MDARQVHVLLNRVRRLAENLIGGFFVASFPMPDAIRLEFFVVTNDDLIFQRVEWVHDRRQRLVLHHDILDGIGGDVAVGGDDAADFLRIIDHFLGRQHHLRIRHEGGHPVEVMRGQIFAGNHRQDTRYRQRCAGVNIQDFGVRIGAAHNVHMQHAGQFDVIDIATLALKEAWVFLALHAVSHAAHF